MPSDNGTEHIWPPATKLPKVIREAHQELVGRYGCWYYFNSSIDTQLKLF